MLIVSHIDTESSPEESAALYHELAQRLEEVVPQTDPNRETTETLVPRDDGGCYVVRRASGRTVKDGGYIFEFQDARDTLSPNRVFVFEGSGSLISLYNEKPERSCPNVAAEMVALLRTKRGELRSGSIGAFYGNGEALPETSMSETEQFEAYRRLQELADELCDESDAQHHRSYIPGDSEWDSPEGAADTMMTLRVEQSNGVVYITERALLEQPNGTLQDGYREYRFNNTGGLIDRRTNRPVPDKAAEFAELIELDRRIGGDPELLGAPELLLSSLNDLFVGMEPGSHSINLVDSRDSSRNLFIHQTVERDQTGMETVRYGILETKEFGSKKIFTRFFEIQEDEPLIRTQSEKPDARAAARLADIVEHGEEPR